MKSKIGFYILFIIFITTKCSGEEIKYICREFFPHIPTQKPINIIMPSVINPNSFYVGTEGDGVFQFIDKVGWGTLNVGLNSDSAKSITGFAIKKGKHHTSLLLGTKSGLFSSTDGGANWDLPFLKQKINCLAAYNDFDSLVFVGTDSGIFEISDSLKQLVPKITLIKNITITVNQFGTYYLYIMANNSLFRLIGRHKNWPAIGDTISHDYTADSVNVVAIHPADPELVYIGTKNHSIFRAENGGKKLWEKTNSGNFSYWQVNSILIHQKQPSCLSMISFNRGEQISYIYRSKNNGKQWSDTEWKSGIADSISYLLNSNEFLCLLESPTGLLIGTSRGFLLSFIRKDNKVHQNWCYSQFWEGKRRWVSLPVGIVGLSWGIYKICWKKPSVPVIHVELPNPPHIYR